MRIARAPNFYNRESQWPLGRSPGLIVVVAGEPPRNLRNVRRHRLRTPDIPPSVVPTVRQLSRDQNRAGTNRKRALRQLRVSPGSLLGGSPSLVEFGVGRGYSRVVDDESKRRLNRRRHRGSRCAIGSALLRLAICDGARRLEGIQKLPAAVRDLPTTVVPQHVGTAENVELRDAGSQTLRSVGPLRSA